MLKALSVVIPNFNGASLLGQTLPTVFETLKLSGLVYEVIVSDDCSTDRSIEFLKENFPEVLIVQASHNSGFSVTANRGMAAARYDHALLLNSDVKLEPGYFDHQLHYFENPATFGVMGRIIGWDDDQIQDGAKYPSFHSAKIKTSLNYLLRNEQEMEAGLYTMYLSGANALVDRKKFMAIGGFNELFTPFYVEDYELSLRAWRLGWTCWYEHRAVCRHRTSTTIKSSSRKWYVKMISNRNKWFLHAIHLKGVRKYLWYVQMIPEMLIQSLFLKSYYFSAFIAFLHSRSGIKSSKRALQDLAGTKKLRSVPEVASLIEKSVEGRDAYFFR